ncbi:hypothetical protein RCL_jg18246.t1 [Rhizophagus clarus]|uniref:DUF659 domain-containing protein n=1 Tax=Rhizophagus clarus TaxID=94130 RepID=A0A8H3QNC5_9GLOM|nr:hypothetical protein RCL_jg18246.t1 [Rhizophagus clarus]
MPQNIRFIKRRGGRKEKLFSNKTDKITQHCTHFLAAITPEIRDEIFSLSKNSGNQIENKRLFSCKWTLHRVNNHEAKELFEFLNPFLKLPDRKTLAQKEAYLEAMEKTESMIADLEKNICAVVTDSAGAYAAAR